jgi:3-hydroxyacyl-[acyl-carrier-protein] dehydratase
VRVIPKDRYVETAEISPDHPALAGHFAGNPIAPGALLLVYVEGAVSRAFGRGVLHVVLARFHAPLQPSQSFTIELQQRHGDLVDFRVAVAGKLIAGGKLRLIAERN